MTKELYEALLTIGDECDLHGSCYDCPLSTTKFEDTYSLCVFKHMNPHTLSLKIIKKEVYDLDESIR